MSSKVIMLILLGVVAAYVIFSLGRFLYYFNISKGLIGAQRYDVRVPTDDPSVLVVGDSSAVGVGASSPEDSLPAHLARKLNSHYVENHAVSGARIADMKEQLSQAEQTSYAVALIMIGGNDITHLMSAADAKAAMRPVLVELKKKAGRVIFISAGNIGAARLFPWPFSYFYTKLNLEYHAVFQALSDELGVEYVNQYTDPSVDPFVLHPEIYLAADGFHPSSKGYEMWYERIK